MSDFDVTIEALRGMVGRHGKVREDLTSVNEQSRLLAQIRPPMTDPATTEYVTAACAAGQRHLDDVTKLEQELQARIDELKASVDQYERTEQGNQRRMAVQD
ncbi:hypothetical protein ACWGE0_43020 [Lentzea sp. NPDC054927]